MIVLGLDFEATDKDPLTSKILEVGVVVYDTEARVPLEVFNSLVRPPDQLPEGYVSPTGIKLEWIFKYGRSLPSVLGEVQRIIAASAPACVVAHNCLKYDKPLAMAELARHAIVGHELESMLWVDPRFHIPWRDGIGSKSLTNVAAEHLILNYFPHRALFDVMTMLKVTDHYDMGVAVENAKIPMITVRALTGYADREKAKDAKFYWSGDDRKLWLKEIPETAFDAEAAAAAEKGFKIARI